jgi:hypothetical protein
MLLSLVLMLIGIVPSTILIVIVLAFIVETILLLCKRFSPSQIISCILVGILIHDIINDITKRDIERNKSKSEQINDIVYICRTAARPIKPLLA